MTDAEIGVAIRPVRIVIPAMAAGIVAFGVTAVVIVTGGTMPTRPELANVLLAALGGLVVVEILIYPFLRRALAAGRRGRWEAEGEPEPTAAGFARGFQIVTLVAGALSEAPSLFGVAIYLLTGHWAGLIVPALGLVLLALLVPSADRFRRFVAEVTGRYWN